MRKTYIILLLSLACCSCKKWLDVKPQTSVTDEELFKTEEGFEEALNGVYLNCSRTALYGGELTMGFPDVLAQNYSIRIYDQLRYLQTSRYLYTDQDFVLRKDSVWQGLYSGILNCNMVLQNIDQHRNLFTGNHYAIIKGEALALRGYLHFDLLRLFAPSFKTGAQSKAIPYVTTYSNKITPLSTVTEVLQKAVADLNNAKTLLYAADSIRSTGYIVGYPNADTATEQNAKTLFVQNRRHHLNYFAVCGELARVYLYLNNTADALKNAEEVINANKFPWTADADFNNADPKLKDHIYYKELLFAWNIPKEGDNLVKRFTTGNSSLDLVETGATYLYETGSVGGEDNRFKQWFQPVSEDNVTRYELQKYKRNTLAAPTDLTANRHPLVAPAIRLSEMYYIAAECSFDTDPAKALQYFNTVRSHRGIIAQLSTSSKTELLAELLKEARKEWYGEGQIFYMYKRLNQSIIAESGQVVPAGNNVFVLPLPNDEIEFGNR
ncbi:RagB/SusD family nutrient uptake outer membrane protein [Deminuibacter soli]|uniref:RagB/SusD family nutrient uptake outer membrane protein n=1 Tax=Deminuibacter soli TaxID=2291815 RepID=A0A3E1NJU9_9BACT|nr:RagB/SusD family nutrient uptake outer membrane protein [Deminuibacter soli]RFM28203.1 RagB/SusD family nutrient uptake outer membrane protein [Deminuibacter soli]